SAPRFRAHGPGDHVQRCQVLLAAVRHQNDLDVAARHRRARLRLHGKRERSRALQIVIFSPKGRPILRRAFAIGLLLAGTVVSVQAQWLKHRDPTIPRASDGKPNLTAPAPRFNGKPDLTGVWEAERTSADEYGKALGPGFSQLQVDFNDVTKHVI